MPHHSPHHFTLAPLTAIRRAGWIGWLLVWLVCIPVVSEAANAGFRTIGIWNEDESARLDLCVWYPVASSPSLARYGEWSFRVNRRVNPLEGAFPLVVISHESGTNRFFHHNLATELAKQGFVVAAPTHTGDNLGNMDSIFTARQFTGRIDDMRLTVERLSTDPDLGAHIDLDRISIVGFGTGASAALLAAGGSLSSSSWERWKETAPKDSPYVKTWARQRLDRMMADMELLEPQPLFRIRSLVLIAPTHGMFFDASSLSSVTLPVLLVAAESDPLISSTEHVMGLKEALPTPAHFVSVPGARLLDFMARPEGNVAVLPGFSLPSPRQHTHITSLMIKEVSQFLLETIGTP